MSGTEVDDGEPRLIAAEYVLGTLDTTEAATAAVRVQAEAGFAEEVRFWERRLFPLTELVPPVPAPEGLLPRIEATIGVSGQGSNAVAGGAARAANDNALRFWRAAAVTGFAVAASLAAVLVLRPAPAPLVAVLSPTGSTLAVLVAVTEPDGKVAVRPSGVLQIAAGRDLQMWSLPEGASKPVSLGLLPVGGTMVPGVAAGTKLLVSLEPTGGSPTGLPTGPVVYGGVLQATK